MEPGIYDNITNHDYHKGPGISKSGLDLIAQSPAHYYHAVNAANDNEPTAAQAFGTAFHTLLLEPEVFAATYVSELRKDEYPDAIDDREKLVEMVRVLNETRLPKLSLTGSKPELINRICDNTSHYVPADLEKSKADELKYILEEMNKGRTGLLSTTGSMNELAAILRANDHSFTLWSEIKADHTTKIEGKTVLTTDQWDQLHAMRDAVMAHPAASYLMKLPGKAEQSVYWNDPKTGVLCRCRPDWWTQSNIVVDLKTCIDASSEGFAKSIYNWRYHVQDVMYRDGIKIATGNEPQFVFLAVEKDACVVNGTSKGVAVYVLDDESRAAGLKEYRQSLNEYASCLETDKWPGYDNKVQIISIPAWGLKKAEVI
ncbi:putative exonuclease [Acinetobacter phage vB_AbaP_Alexa]|nr:putative exonuclease [Acinetobacter phage vB_AbaP_Alexa]